MNKITSHFKLKHNFHTSRIAFQNRYNNISTGNSVLAASVRHQDGNLQELPGELLLESRRGIHQDR